MREATQLYNVDKESFKDSFRDLKVKGQDPMNSEASVSQSRRYGAPQKIETSVVMFRTVTLKGEISTSSEASVS